MMPATDKKRQSDYHASLAKAAAREGRKFADMVADISPGHWSMAQRQFYLDHFADALARTFPGGPQAFLAFAPIVVERARRVFDDRIRELGITVDTGSEAR